MSDERRAEIEAVARALYEQGFGFNIDADDTARESMFSVACVVLDRLRDARGDDMDEHDDEVEARLLARLERDGLFREGMTATDARRFLDG